MNHEIVPPGIYGTSRRKFLGGLGLLAARVALDLTLPSSVKAQETEKEEYSPVLVRKDDGVFSICRFYGMSDQETAKSMADIAKKNHLKDINKIQPDKLLYLPLSAEEASFPFRRFAFQIEGSEFASSVSMTNDSKLFQEVNDNQILYVPDWPYVFWGHSAEIGVPQDCYSFQILLRKLLVSPEKVKIWLSRSITGDLGTWVRCRVDKDEVEYITGAINNGDLGGKLRKLPYNSQKIMFCTCATEMGKYDRLIAMATLHFADAKDPPLYGLNTPVSEK